MRSTPCTILAVCLVIAAAGLQTVGSASVLPSPGPGDEILFAKAQLGSSSNQYLVRVDHLTTPGLCEVIGPIGFGNINGMDFDPDGQFFAIGNAPGVPGKVLIEIDPATGAGTRIGGPLSGGVDASFAINSSGDLFGAGSSDNLYSINRTTGMSTLIGFFGVDTSHQGMDFDPDDTLFLLTNNAGLTSDRRPAVLTINTTTGRATIVAEFTADFGAGPESLFGRTGSYDMSFSQDGILYASLMLDGMPQLLIVDPATGVGTPVGQLQFVPGTDPRFDIKTSSLAFGPSSWANIPPVAVIAGPDRVEAESWTGTAVGLDGSASYDPDTDNPLTFEWLDDYGSILGNDAAVTPTLPLGSNRIVLNVTDSGGKIGTDSKTVWVLDTTAPTIDCPDDLTMEGQGPEGVPTTHTAIQLFLAGAEASDIADPDPLITHNAPSGSFPLGETVVTFTAMDESGNNAACQASVAILDTTPPEIACPDPITLELQSAEGVPADQSEIQAFLSGVSSSDICDPSPVIVDDHPDPFPQGVTVVTFTATDEWGNQSSCQSEVSVIDTIPPEIECPEDITLEGQGPAGVPVTDPAIQSFLDGATATDAVDPDPVIANDGPLDYFPLGSTVVTFTATDESGNASSCQATVTVVDTTPPEMICPDPITVWGLDPDGIPVASPAIQAFLAAAGATDVCDPAPTVDNDAPAGHFPFGMTIVHFVATDAAGNTTHDESSVEVINSPPVVGPIHVTDKPVATGVGVEVWAPFTDPNPDVMHTALWEWDDGSSSPGEVDEEDGGGTVSATHVYAVPDEYTIKVTVTDDCGESGEAQYQFLIVYQPDGPFVTGGGWIVSPAGAYAEKPEIEDRATFGLVAKYNDDDAPTGQIEFNFSKARMNFHSKSYDWLIVHGATAAWTGTGEIKNGPQVRFRMTAVDAEVDPDDSHEADAIRLVLWDEATGSLIYDNQSGADLRSGAATELGGGSISIHERN